VKQLQRYIPGWFAAMIVGSAAICVVGLTRPEVSAPPVTQGPVEVQGKELYDVMWIDRYPEMPSDTFKGYTFTGDNVGISLDFHSAYKLTLELF